jgi:hypothetical protein
MNAKMTRWIIVGAVLAALIVVAAVIIAFVACSPSSKPITRILLPAVDKPITEGDDLVIRSTSADPKGIVRVELAVDSVIVHVDDLTGHQQFVDVSQPWKAKQGLHTISVRAFNASNVPSDPALMNVTVFPTLTRVPTQVAMVTGTPPPGPVINTPVPAPLTAQPGACTSNAAFIAHASVPNGTNFNPGQSFDKVWRVLNNGTCPWDPDFQLAYVGGDQMTTMTSSPIPYAAPGGSIEIHLAMTAPSGPGAHTSQWQLRDANGVGFGPQLGVSINVANVPSTATPMPAQAVIGVMASANPTNYSGNCPGVFNLSGTVTTNRAGSITYRWATSSQGSSDPMVFNAPNAGAFTLPAYQVTPNVKGLIWGQLVVLSPNQLSSGQAQFTNNCTDPKPAPPQASILQPGSGYSTQINQPVHFVFQGSSTSEVSSLSLYANGNLLNRQATRSSVHQLQGTFDWIPVVGGSYDVYVIAADIFGQQTTSGHITVIVRQPASTPTPRPTYTPVPIPTAVQRPNVSGSWSGGRFSMQISEAFGCGGPVCSVAGTWMEWTGGTPEDVDITGSFNGTTLSLTIPGYFPGAPTISFSGTVDRSGNSISGRLSTGESITFGRS